MEGDDVPEPTDDGGDASRREKAVDQFDAGIVDLLSWVLDTETRAKIYIYLQANPSSTSEEIAQGTGLYPSTVREALAELHDEDTVTREKRESKGAGNNPYEYTAIAPSDLVSDVVGQVQDELNTVFNLENVLDRTGDDAGDATTVKEPADEPVTITVSSESDADSTTGGDGVDASTDGDGEAVDDAATDDDAGGEDDSGDATASDENGTS